MKNTKKQAPETNVERFYRWMEEMGNVHLGNHEAMVKAFHKVATN